MNSRIQQFWINLVLVLSWLTTVIRYRNRRPKPAEVKGILVFQLTELGDVALATDVLARLRSHYPGARLTLVCGPWAQPMMVGQPLVDEIFVYQSSLSMTGKHDRIRWPEHWQSVRRMARIPADLLVDLRGNLGSVAVAWFSPARFRVDRGSLRWRDILQRRQVWDRHETVLNWEIIQPLGIGFSPPRLELVPLPEAEVSLNPILHSQGFSLNTPFVVLHPGSSWIAKRWREERFAALGERIQEEIGLRVVLTGSKGERAIGESIVAAMKSPPVNLIGLLSMRELLSLYARATLWVGNDTGTMHVAVALGRPVIVLWGPTKLEKFGPCGPQALVITGKGSSGSAGGIRSKMDLIQVSEVWRAVQQKLNPNSEVEREIDLHRAFNVQL